jgi:hypothetical protein
LHGQYAPAYFTIAPGGLSSGRARRANARPRLRGMTTAAWRRRDWPHQLSEAMVTTCPHRSSQWIFSFVVVGRRRALRKKRGRRPRRGHAPPPIARQSRSPAFSPPTTVQSCLSFQNIAPKYAVSCGFPPSFQHQRGPSPCRRRVGAPVQGSADYHAAPDSPRSPGPRGLPNNPCRPLDALLAPTPTIGRAHCAPPFSLALRWSYDRLRRWLSWWPFAPRRRCPALRPGSAGSN